MRLSVLDISSPLTRKCVARECRTAARSMEAVFYLPARMGGFRETMGISLPLMADPGVDDEQFRLTERRQRR